MSPRLSGPALGAPALLVDVPATADAGGIDEEVLALFDAFRDQLLRYVCTFGLPMREAEDLVQDAFVALFRHLRNDGARTNLRGWLFRVAHNMALKKVAQRQRECHRFPAIDDAGSNVVDPAADPEGRLARRQQRQRVAAILNALPARDRDCVRLRSNGLRYREIAQVLGISLGAVAKSMTRAIDRLQRGTGGQACG